MSRKKIHCHELCYAKFDPTTQPRPVICFTDFELPEEEVNEAIQKAMREQKKELAAHKIAMNVPDHVPSVKSLSDFQRNQSLNVKNITTRPPPEMIADIPQEVHQGENPIRQLKNDALLEEIRNWKKNINKRNEEGSLTEKIVQALQRAEDLLRDGPRRGELKKRDQGKQASDVDLQNVVKARRNRDKALKKKVGDSSSTVRVARSTNVIRVKPSPDQKNGKLKVGDKVKTSTERFGKEWAVGRPKFTFGVVKKIKGDLVSILWEGELRRMNAKAHHLVRVKGASIMMATKSRGRFACPTYNVVSEDEPVDWLIDGAMEQDRCKSNAVEDEIRRKAMVQFKAENKFLPDEWIARTILPIMEVGASISTEEMGGTWPRDFYEALIRPDWRLWVEAVKNELESWTAFEACEEVTYDQIQKGASVIPLGELFTIKRSGKYKFRQIALGNLLKEGKDYAETFASTISGDGIRWFCAVAASCGRKIYGWDAKTGYLQTVQRIPIYAYLPSHHGYSDLSYEKLAHLRMQLLITLKKEGIEGVKRFSRNMRKERRLFTLIISAMFMRYSPVVPMKSSGLRTKSFM